MIIVDTNIIAYFWLPGEYSDNAKDLYKQDPEWAAPILWRSEFRSILSLYIRKKVLKISDAVEIIINAENMMRGNEFSIDSISLINIVNECSLSAYDLEFIVLAESFNVNLVTLDKKILNEFPKLAISLSNSIKR